ncbi:hypothetical protein GCM10007933_33620 [Zoogloea oryzae]|uniref:PXPV repeat-containing protein n=1 Tax=Zoogloea oryzae TaxID=310767 RepID=A0ABQ6FG79_9RHOO|nr:hypothetical protein [Zoogloea oryzae]GLT23891.1 hypothetical protein GCM10007933_33620 [Zoogloea oryzae]
MRNTRQMIAAAVLGSLAFGMALPASAHGDRGRGWGERHHHHPRHYHDYRGSYAYAPAPVYMAPPPMVIERPVVYRPAPVYAYPSAPAITIGLPPVVIPLR